MTKTITPETPAEIHSTGERYWEIDAARGAAIIGMIFFHFAAALVMFHLVEETDRFLAVFNTYVFGTAVFVILAGISMVLRHERMRFKGKTDKEYYKTLVFRALLLFAIGMGITLVTWIFSLIVSDGQNFIKFGFLHMLGISMLIAIPLLRFRKWNILFGAILMAIGILLIPQITSPEWLFPLGIHSAEFLLYTPDYFPILPWAGVLLLGVGFGNVFYPNGIRGFKLTYKPKKFIRFLAKTGNGMVTLIIYLVHMPIIMGILMLYCTITGVGGL
ncbi:MAG TPA: heparan-alpha-glucosaminide N-acetyltransferase [Methanocorpusculum sp.]|nr:heparan-alpha-glucosaminide N-acetyltransferase [Methanocorpusculum sp.]